VRASTELSRSLYQTMNNHLNFAKICQDFLKDLSARHKEIILRRFGFKSGRRETLESIGMNYGITRERVRQIERDSFVKMKPKIQKYEKVFTSLVNHFKKHGELKREDILLLQLTGPRFHPHLNFLLSLHSRFSRFPDSKEFYPLWTINNNSLKLAQQVNNFLISKFKEKGTPLPFSKVFELCKKNPLVIKKSLNSPAILSFIEASKGIEQGMNSLFGLKGWPEINPKGVKDKAFLVLKIEKKPVHFNAIASLISKLPLQKKPEEKKEVISQTVHNELIKDPRFVLVGRGMYALSEWGYEPGVVKDIIVRLLKEKEKSMTRGEIIEKTLQQRFVKESTIIFNLQDKGYFLKNSDGKYTLRKI